MAHSPTASSSPSYTPLSTPSLPALVSATSPTTASAGDDNDEQTHRLACSLETFSFGSASSATAAAAVSAVVVGGKMSLPSFPAYCLPLATKDNNVGGSDDEGAAQRTIAPLPSAPLSAGETVSPSRLVQPAGTPVVELGCFEYPAWDDCEAESTSDGPPYYRPSSSSPSATLSFPSGRRNSSALSAACYANLPPPTWSHAVAAASEAHVAAHRLSLSSSSASLTASTAWPPVRPAPTPQGRPPLQGLLVHDGTRRRGSTSAPQLPTASDDGHQLVAAFASRVLEPSFDATTAVPRRPSAPLPGLAGSAGSLQRASSHHRPSLPLLFQHSHLHPARPHPSTSCLSSSSTTPTPTQHYFVPLAQEAPVPPSLVDHPALAKRRGSLPGQQATRPAVSPLLRRHRLSSDESSGTPNTASHSRPPSTSPPPLEGEALVRAVVAEHGRRQQLRAAEESAAAAAATATAGVSRPRLESIVSVGSQESAVSSAGSGGKSNGGSSLLSGSSEALGQSEKAVVAVPPPTAAKGVAVSL